jgi:hypothetical protein
LRLSLPEAAGMRARCLDPSGRLLAAFERPALAAGYYDIPLGPRGSGLRIVIVDFAGGAGPRRIALKTAAP